MKEGMPLKNEQFPFKSPVKPLFKKFAETKEVSLIYGEPIEVGLNKIVPVAKAGYMIGGGAGGGLAGKKDSDIGGGDGAGGCISIKPVGVYVITPDTVKFKPVYSQRKWLAIASIIGIGLFVITNRKK
ncbi:spore germination protein GerW family protein [Sporosarcina contaminans]|uniref:Spore germination protein GerW family protein n=1 Tax=Sporosarcina contaminans TaxID=633403 RepID=A0ABW3U4I6_9BACL